MRPVVMWYVITSVAWHDSQMETDTHALWSHYWLCIIDQTQHSTLQQTQFISTPHNACHLATPRLCTWSPFNVNPDYKITASHSYLETWSILSGNIVFILFTNAGVVSAVLGRYNILYISVLCSFMWVQQMYSLAHNYRHCFMWVQQMYSFSLITAGTALCECSRCTVWLITAGTALCECSRCTVWFITAGTALCECSRCTVWHITAGTALCECSRRTV